MPTFLTVKAPLPKPSIHLQGAAATGTTFTTAPTPFKQQLDTFLEEPETEAVNPRDDEPQV